MNYELRITNYKLYIFRLVVSMVDVNIFLISKQSAFNDEN